MHFIHIGCNGTSQKEYNHHDNSVWNCLLCNITGNLDRLPFTKIDNTELININHTDSMKFLESLPNVEIKFIMKQKHSDFSSNDINNVLPSKTNCKYYPVNEYHSLKKNNLNIFHVNVNGLGSKLDLNWYILKVRFLFEKY